MKGIAVNRLNRNVSWIVLLIVSMLCLFNMSSVLAHAMLVKAEPAKRASLTTAPSQVRLWFNEEIEPAFATLSVLDVNKTAVTGDKAVVDSGDPKSIILKLPEIQPGRYTVKFRVLSVDGHVVDSEYEFTIKE
ncbi:MAG: copper resistance protein CopC [Nitrosomonas sp.]|nr:copper resistance protein CopC [Nitrosomonas sp.]MBK7365756.1 copper resistance protein CopC [Nitrosomonas sp.]